MGFLINSQLPAFALQAYHNGEFKLITHNDLLEKWAILFFYPTDFSQASPTELINLAQMQEEFRSIGVEIYAINTDSHFVHKAWYDLSPHIQHIDFPLLSDPLGQLSRALGVMDEEEGMPYCATFVTNPEGKIKIAEVGDQSIHRNADELMRKVKAALFVTANPGEVCPARWHEGDPTLKPSINLVGKI